MTARPGHLVPVPGLPEVPELLDRAARALDALSAELERERAAHAQARNRLALLRADHARLLAATRATVAADWDGEPDPVMYVRGLLQETGQAPARGMHAPGVLAAARDNLALAGWRPSVTHPSPPVSDPAVRARCQGSDRGTPAIVTPRPPAALSGAPGRPDTARRGATPAGLGTSQERTARR